MSKLQGYKYTYEELITALEEYEVVCDECGCNDGDMTGKKIMLEALDLIKQQKEENDVLRKRIEGQKSALFKQQAYTAELQAEITRRTIVNGNI